MLLSSLRLVQLPLRSRVTAGASQAATCGAGWNLLRNRDPIQTQRCLMCMQLRQSHKQHCPVQHLRSYLTCEHETISHHPGDRHDHFRIDFQRIFCPLILHLSHKVWLGASFYDMRIMQHIARLGMCAQVVDRLIAAGARLDAVQTDMWTALHLAAQNLSSEVRVDLGRFIFTSL